MKHDGSGDERDGLYALSTTTWLPTSSSSYKDRQSSPRVVGNRSIDESQCAFECGRFQRAGASGFLPSLAKARFARRPRFARFLFGQNMEHVHADAAISRRVDKPDLLVPLLQGLGKLKRLLSRVFSAPR